MFHEKQDQKTKNSKKLIQKRTKKKIIAHIQKRKIMPITQQNTVAIKSKTAKKAAKTTLNKK